MGGNKMSHKHYKRRARELEQQVEHLRQREKTLQKELEYQRELYKEELNRIQETGDEILSLVSPSPVTVGLLGKLKLELPCLKVNCDGSLNQSQAAHIIGTIVEVLKRLDIAVNVK
jgi:hypothetical protein